ncbi:MAG TPA: T9SS type A sorting domain-containing protein [Bacteroidia bacterium]|nr:T9SS type A sorting domain-containing protein [Bacteroidia bacterium]
MIKKLLSIASFCAIFSVTNAQNNFVAQPAGPLKKQVAIESPNKNLNDAKASALATGDTLWYYYNKHFYRNPPSTGFYTFMSPNSFTITKMGARFNNTNPNLSITGLECIASRNASSPSASVTVRMYLYNVVAGLPSAPALDSVSAVVSSTLGNFYGGNFTTPKFVSGDYAVLYQCIPTVAGDSAKMWMNNANTPTSTATSSMKYGEGYGYLKYGTSFMTTTNLYGSGTDYEFMVAARVAFSASASQNSPVTTLCTNTSYAFNNTSSFPLAHRQYNLNEFYRFWKPFSNTVTITPDSVYTWNFGDATGNFYTPSSNPNINHTYTGAGTFTGTLTAKYQRMVDSGVRLQDATTFAKTVSTCAGIQVFSGVEAVNVYPNPSTGLVYVANLPSESTIEVVNMLGQSVYKATANAGNFTADLSALTNGSYFVKINSINEKTKIVKLILN